MTNLRCSAREPGRGCEEATTTVGFCSEPNGHGKDRTVMRNRNSAQGKACPAALLFIHLLKIIRIMKGIQVFLQRYTSFIKIH